MEVDGNDLVTKFEFSCGIAHFNPQDGVSSAENSIIQQFVQEMSGAKPCGMLILVDYQALSRKLQTILISSAKRKGKPFRTTSKTLFAYSRKSRRPRRLLWITPPATNRGSDNKLFTWTTWFLED